MRNDFRTNFPILARLRFSEERCRPSAGAASWPRSGAAQAFACSNCGSVVGAGSMFAIWAQSRRPLKRCRSRA